MKISKNKFASICREQNISITRLLDAAGVSRNAFYTLARKENILPCSIIAIADALSVPASEFLETVPAAAERTQQLLEEANRIKMQNPAADADNIRHTLQLLNEKPLNRLRRALTRAQRFDFQ